MITDLEHIKTTIENKGVKASYQRLKIMEYLLKTKNHPTVDNIYEVMVKEIPTLSKTTVYNTMNLFVEKNIIKALSFTGVETRYDIVTQSHHHFICNQCHKIYDINTACSFMCDNHKIINGNKIEEVIGYFKGICKECINNKT